MDDFIVRHQCLQKTGQRRDVQVNWKQALAFEKQELINGALDLLLPPSSTYPFQIHELCATVFLPVENVAQCPCCSSAEVLGTDQQSFTCSCRIETIHTYSLIHDDTPAMDDDDYRR